MTWEKYQDLYREAWRIQAKKDKDANPALRLSQKPMKNATLSKAGASRGGKNSSRVHTHIQEQLSLFPKSLLSH